MTNVIPPGFQIHAEQVTADGRDVRLELLRAPFEPHQISKVPKPTKEQSDEKTRPYWVRCEVCDGWHNPQVKHLDYVGHAALTDRLLQADPYWYWEPLASDHITGLPRFDSDGGLWIKLTICGITRLGYGHAEEKTYMDKGARVKEVIGDAMRNAAMRFGAALDLWHKGDLHKEADNGSGAASDTLGVIAGQWNATAKGAQQVRRAAGTLQDPIIEYEEMKQDPGVEILAAPGGGRRWAVTKVDENPEKLDPVIVGRLTDTLSLSSLQMEFGQLDTENRRVHYSVFDGHRKALAARMAITGKDNAFKDSADILKEEADLDGPYGPSGV